MSDSSALIALSEAVARMEKRQVAQSHELAKIIELVAGQGNRVVDLHERLRQAAISIYPDLGGNGSVRP